MSKISIITVTRNRPELLSLKAYASLLNQTDSNFEWIVINDGGERKNEKHRGASTKKDARNLSRND